MAVLESRGFLTGFATLVLFTGVAGDAWRNSISWYGFGAVGLLIIAASIAILVRHRASLRFGTLPWPLLAFLTLATASIAWSFYPGASALGVLAQFVTTLPALAIALVLTGPEILRSLGRALRIVLVLSLLFELVVAFIVRAPVLPVWATAADRADPPLMLFWSRNLLLAGDKIQGIVGNSALLSMIGLLALIVFSVQLASGTIKRMSGVLAILLAVVIIGLTRSATIYAALVAVAVVLAMILVMRRARTPRARLVAYAGITVAVAACVGLALLFQTTLLSLVGKSDNLTGRSGIWDAVIGLAQQRPVAGWGWVSFWPPWVEPFNGLIVRNGVMQLHAHNAWLDVWLQLGVLGLVVFGLLVATTAVRAWLTATDRVVSSPGETGPFSAGSLLAPLLLTALLVQSLAESRILVEGGWMLLVILATSTKLAMLGRR
ncbi:MAG: O-antigen ligase family protein, partial [Burkholderiaceae bacterium]|nr:O-antigen ligase family protein [Microbacteriaceae bacterium]